jgi:hypothetical protein
LAISPALAQKIDEQTPKQPTLIGQNATWGRRAMIIGDYAHKFWRYLSVAGAVAIFFGASLFIVTVS